MTDDAPGPAAYWTGTVAAVAGVVTAVLLAVGMPLNERGVESAVVDVLFYAAMCTGAVSLVAAPVAAFLGERRMAAWGSVGVLAWALTMTYFVLTAD